MMSQSWSNPVTSQRDWKKGFEQEMTVVIMPHDRGEYHCSTVKTSDD